MIRYMIGIHLVLLCDGEQSAEEPLGPDSCAAGAGGGVVLRVTPRHVLYLVLGQNIVMTPQLCAVIVHRHLQHTFTSL
jgi:hypothetical protein